jgi:hypothetical protein
MFYWLACRIMLAACAARADEEDTLAHRQFDHRGGTDTTARMVGSL